MVDAVLVCSMDQAIIALLLSHNFTLTLPSCVCLYGVSSSYSVTLCSTRFESLVENKDMLILSRYINNCTHEIIASELGIIVSCPSPSHHQGVVW